jgi:ribosomal protein L31
MSGILATNSSFYHYEGSTTAPVHVPRYTRAVSSSPYGRTHVWKRRPKKLPNPIVPQFPQRVIRADGSSFTHWTTSPRPLIRLTRDVTNHPLWNVSALTGEGAAEESEVTGRLGRFNRKFVEDIDWMGEAEGALPATSTTKPKCDDGCGKEVGKCDGHPCLETRHG